MQFQALLLLIAPAVCYGLLFGSRDQANWNGLKVTWGLNPFSSFQSVPRTRVDAESDGWVNMAPGVACDGNANFLGFRYWKDNDLSVILVFDANGYIAGIQAGFSKDYMPNANHYPFNHLKNKPFVLDGNNYFVTAYFVTPAIVCKGRSAAEFNVQGTGTGLWIQNGTSPLTSSVKMPAKQAQADNTKWTKGACFYTMGHHYWYNLRKDMSCDDFFPVFLLYNGGDLNAFGWAFGIDLTNTNRVEHPPHSSYGNFMTVVPDCVPAMGTLTTLHIYLTDSATSDTC